MMTCVSVHTACALSHLHESSGGTNQAAVWIGHVCARGRVDHSRRWDGPAPTEFLAALGLKVGACVKARSVCDLGLSDLGLQTLLGGPQPRTTRAAISQL
jgi:hypothetical protein